MSGGWGSIVDAQGRFSGAGGIENGGDAEELAEDLFGVVWWLAGQLAVQDAGGGEPVRRDEALLWIRQADQHAREGFEVGGRSAGDDESGYWE